MRIIGGKFKGRKFTTPAKSWPTRPTTDIAKEGLFNILNNRLDFESLKVLDLFGGTGSHSYEFISRGCESVTYVDNFPGCIAFATKMAKELDIESEMRIVKADALRFAQTCGENFDYIFAGPPYGLPSISWIPDLIFEHKLLRQDGLFIMEHNPNHTFKSHAHYQEERNYGKTIFSFFGYPDPVDD